MARIRINDHSGEQIGDWAILEKTTEQTKSGVYKYRGKCIHCGKEKIVTYQAFKNNPLHCTNKDLDSLDLISIKYISTAAIWSGIDEDNNIIIGYACYNEADIQLSYLLPIQITNFTAKELFYPKIFIHEGEVINCVQVKQDSLKIKDYIENIDFPDWYFDGLDLMTYEDAIGGMAIVYFYYNEEKEIIYIGKSTNYYRRHFDHIHCDSDMMNEVKQIGLRFYHTDGAMDLAEIYWIQKYNPKYNKDCMHKDQSFDEVLYDIEFFDHTNELIIPCDELNQYWR